MSENKYLIFSGHKVYRWEPKQTWQGKFKCKYCITVFVVSNTSCPIWSWQILPLNYSKPNIYQSQNFTHVISVQDLKLKTALEGMLSKKNKKHLAKVFSPLQSLPTIWWKWKCHLGRKERGKTSNEELSNPLKNLKSAFIFRTNWKKVIRQTCRSCSTSRKS